MSPTLPQPRPPVEVVDPAGGHYPLYWAEMLFSININDPGATPASGDFGGSDWPNISFSGATATYNVSAGVDLNGDRFLNQIEITHQFDVRVINFTSSAVGSQRIAGVGPVEPGLTTVKYAEHFEVLGTFKFEIMGALPAAPTA